MSEHVGKTIADRYKVVALIGRGGMAEVYLATDEHTDTSVALKIMSIDRYQPDLASRFLRGARLSRRIRHPHVTATFGLGQWGQPPEGHYLVMEYVDGLSLGDLLDVGLGAGAVCAIMSQVLRALAHVHAHGVLHRDIKPDNVMVYRGDDGVLQTKLTDFGIAASLSQDMDVTAAGAGVLVGTPAYMAPEQVEQRGVYAPALDLYAVGTTMYRLLAGSLPFKKSGLGLLVARISEAPIPLVPRPGVEVPDPVTAVVMRLLSRHPEERYPLAADVLHLLEPYCEPAAMSEQRWQSLFASPSDMPTLRDGSYGPAHFESLADTVAFGHAPSGPAGGGVRSDLGPFWGREAFIGRFEEIFASAEEGRGQVATLSGPMGIGKSAIMEHMAFSLAEQGRFIVLRTAYHTHGGGDSGLRHAFETHLGTVGRSEDMVRSAALEFLRRYDDVDSQEADDLVAFLRPRTSTSASDAPDALMFNFALVTRMLRRIGEVKPVMLVLDGMEHGDVEAASFLSHLLFEIRRAPFPIACVGAYCDGLADAAFLKTLSKNDRHLGESFHRFEVPPLATEVLVRGLLTSGELGARTAEMIAERAQGNPLFAVHLARAGAAALGDFPATLPTQAAHVNLPEQLAGVLALSLDERLAKTATPDLLRDVCRCVAVLGDPVRVDLLKRYVDALGLDVDVELALDPLIEVGLLVEGPIQAHDLVALRPALFRDLLLGETPARKGRQLQRLAAEVRMAWSEARADEEAGAIADHLEAAGDPESAVVWWRRSMPYEALAGTPGKGARAGMKALQFIERDSQDYADISIGVGRLLLDMGELDDAAAVLAPVVSGVRTDDALRAGDLLADVYENAGYGDKWDSLLEAMTAREPEAGPTGLQALYCARSMWLNSRGHREQGFAEAQKATEGAKPGREAQRAAQRLVYTCLSRGDLEVGEQAAREALKHAGEQPELKARSLRALGVVLVWKQRGDEAIVQFEALIKLSERHGLHARLPIGWHDLGEAFRVSGRLAEARDAYGKALRTATEMQLLSSVQLIQPKLIICDLLERRFEGVEEKIEGFVPEAVAAGLALAEPFARMLLAWAHALRGSLEEARGAYEAVEDMRDMAIDPQFPLIMEQIAAAFTAGGDVDPAHAPCAREALSLAVEFWGRYGQAERSTRCASELAALAEA